MRAKSPTWAEMLAWTPCRPHPGLGCAHCSMGPPSCPVPPAGLDSRHPGTGVSALALVTFGARSFFEGGKHVCCRMFSSVTGLYSLDSTNSLLPV